MTSLFTNMHLQMLLATTPDSGPWKLEEITHAAQYLPNFHRQTNEEVKATLLLSDRRFYHADTGLEYSSHNQSTQCWSQHAFETLNNKGVKANMIVTLAHIYITARAKGLAEIQPCCRCVYSYYTHYSMPSTSFGHWGWIHRNKGVCAAGTKLDLQSK
jgi:hypothetical protein